MMSKHPLDLPPGRKLSKEEVAEALRLSIIAELDAINLYLQLARAIDDERYRRVFEDIAKEEKTHVGEFLALLKTLDAEQVEELAKGAREVKELTGLEAGDPPTSQQPSAEDIWKSVAEAVTRVVDGARVFRRFVPVARVGRGVDAVAVEPVGGARYVIPLAELSVEFKVSQRAVDYAERFGQVLELGDGYRAAVEFATLEDRLILEKLTELAGAVKAEMSSWEAPGVAVDEAARALAKMVEGGAREPFILFVSPSRYTKLLAVHERTGVMELTRIKGLVKEVVPTPVLPDDTAVVLSANPHILDIAVGVDTQVDYLGPENGYHKLRLWETIAVRPRLEKGVAILKQTR